MVQNRLTFDNMLSWGNLVVPFGNAVIEGRDDSSLIVFGGCCVDADGACPVLDQDAVSRRWRRSITVDLGVYAV
ncbi:uncharacterized protein IUM83_15753 [Phytophthora cinnamomi]|uniref:uncharacterized protein n=1 Tax=Phytophthora cinnamomi TaxID=4785 RepID=UPI002A294E3C|nr:hypothetical protein IUM83_15753 [Phytophthora cinnamomi]KAJ8577779.1 hypothetical protein ON010_g1427 [Phytophthora cinnamomi]